MASTPRIVVLTTEPPPLPGLAATGAGLRAWALAQGLRCAGHEDVTLLIAADAFAASGAKLPDAPIHGVNAEAVPRRELAARIEALRPDALVAQHWGLLRDVEKISCPLAIDLAGPHLLERLFWGSPDPAADRREKLRALARADFVTCSGNSQRHYFLPYLIEAGFGAAPDLCPVIPFSMPPELPVPAPDHDRDPAAFVFGGFFLPWQDPEKPLRWFLDECSARGKGTLEFFGGAHPTLDVSRGRFEPLLDLIEGHPAVRRRGVAPFDELAKTLQRCGAAIDLLPRNLERELAFPSRTVVYLWAGVPVIHGNYGDLGALIEQYKAGWTLDPGDETEFRRLIGHLLDHPEDLAQRSRAAQSLARERLTWDKTIAPLAQWTLNPESRKSRRTAKSPSAAEMAAENPAAGLDNEEELARLRSENERLRGEVEALHASKVVQIARRARGISPLLAPIAFVIGGVIAVILFLLFLLADTIAFLTGRRPHLPAFIRREDDPKKGRKSS